MWEKKRKKSIKKLWVEAHLLLSISHIQYGSDLCHVNCWCVKNTSAPRQISCSLATLSHSCAYQSATSIIPWGLELRKSPAGCCRHTRWSSFPSLPFMLPGHLSGPHVQTVSHLQTLSHCTFFCRVRFAYLLCFLIVLYFLCLCVLSRLSNSLRRYLINSVVTLSLL